MKKPKFEDFSMMNQAQERFVYAQRAYWQWRAGIAEEALKECQKWNVGEDNPPFVIASIVLKLIEESQQ